MTDVVTDAPVERELKYRMSDVAVGDRLLAAEELAGLAALGPASTVGHEDHYLDTADGALARAGWALRLRTGGEADGVVTLKSLRRLEPAPDAEGGAAGALHERDEVEAPGIGPDPEAWPPSDARELVRTIAAGAPLEELVTIRQTRGRRNYGHDGSRVELSVDDVTVIAGEREVERFAELEVELRAGDPVALGQLAVLLSEIEELVPAETSKLERALEGVRRAGLAVGPAADAVLAALAWVDEALDADADTAEPADGAAVRPGEGPPPDAAPGVPEAPEASVGQPEAARPGRRRRKAKASDTDAALAPSGPLETLMAVSLKSPGTAAEDHLAEAGRKVLRFHLARMVAREPGTRLGKDVEELHAMRVATRRQRAAWRVFGDAFDPAATRVHRRRLREVAAKLGAVRDLDVLIEAGEGYRDGQSGADAAAFELLLSAWRRQRENARVTLLAELDSRRYRRWMTEYAAFVQTEGLAALPVGPVDPHRVRDRMPSRIWAAYEQLRAYEPVLRWADVPTIHDLRIAAKWLRYTLEFVREPLGRDAGPLIERVVALQDHLGWMNDADVAAGLARAFLVEHAGRLTEAESAAIGRYLVDREREVQRLRRTMGPTWRGVSSLAFRRALGRVVAGL